jgi:suppressor of fused protein SUFU
MSWAERIRDHYVRNWGEFVRAVPFEKGPVEQLPSDFRVFEFQPGKARTMWTYATCYMSQPTDEQPVELHLFSPIQSLEPVEIFYALAHYHRNERKIGLGHTVNFGKPWLDHSCCTYGLISLPYLDGPQVENCSLGRGRVVKCLWLIPITKAERDFKKAHGLDALEAEFERHNFNYIDPERPSVV